MSEYCKSCYELTEKLQAKEQECEKIKKQYNCYACETCNGKEDYRNMKRHCENAIKANHKYKQILEEIEEFCTVYSDNHDAYETVYKFILSIINKAKYVETLKSRNDNK